MLALSSTQFDPRRTSSGHPSGLREIKPLVCTENLKFDYSGDEFRQGWRVNE
jgi:hypothetical protein